MRSVLVAALLAVLALAAPAAAQEPLLVPEDATDLANALADAQAQQGICYGWQVQVDDASGRYTGSDVGSSRGVGLAAEHPSCPRFLMFRAQLYYTAESDEAGDSASFYVFGNVAGGPDDRDLRRIGISSEALVGAKDDLALANAVLALPALVAERGLAPPVPPDRTLDTIPAVDRPTNRPGSDWTRANGHFLLLSGVLVVGGLGWAAWAWAAGRFDFRSATDEE